MQFLKSKQCARDFGCLQRTCEIIHHNANGFGVRVSARARAKRLHFIFFLMQNSQHKNENGQPCTEQPGDHCAQQINEQTNTLYASEHLHRTMCKKKRSIEERIKIHNSSVIF